MALALGACPSDASTADGTDTTGDAAPLDGDDDAPLDDAPHVDATAPDATPPDTTTRDTIPLDTLIADALATDVDGGSDATATAPVMRVHVLDMGQGEAILVELPCGAMLIDTGGELTEPVAGAPGFDAIEALEASLRAFFVARPDLDRTLDLLVLTHPHIDHTRGVTRLLEMVAAGDLVIRHVVTNGDEGSASGSREQRALHDWVDATPGVDRWYVLQRTTGATGLVNSIIDPFPACARDGGAAIDPKVTALWGRVDSQSTHAATWDDADLDNDNNHSVVLRVDFGEASALFTGDLEEAGIAALIAQYQGTGLLDVDLYKAGHHGSHNGTTGALVNAMTPRAAVISCGPPDREADWTAWAYGHPRWRAVSDLLGDGDSVGVADDRPSAIDALVATGYSGGHGVFESRHIAPAVYTTGWARTAIVVGLRADGTIELPD